jgi:DNA-binding ferritin-like protein (Dps family)
MTILEFFKKMVGDKKEYKMMMARVGAMPKDYQFVFKKIQHYMFSHAGGDGMDMLKIQYDLIDLFENGAANGKDILEITGTDVAEFCDELLRSTKTWTAGWHEALNSDIIKKLGKRKQ